jgi:hypothetical protein
MNEIERIRALAHYSSERDRPPVDAHRALGVVPTNSRRASWSRWVARSLFAGLAIDTLFVEANRSLNVGLSSFDYVSFAQIRVLLYAALGLAVLSHRLWRLP